MAAVHVARGEIPDEASERRVLGKSHLPVDNLEARSRQNSNPSQADVEATMSVGPNRPSQLATGNSHSKSILTANKPAMKEDAATVPAANQL